MKRDWPENVLREFGEVCIAVLGRWPVNARGCRKAP